MDTWINDKPLIDVAIKPIPQHLLDQPIREYTTTTIGVWNWNKISEYLPSTLLLSLAGSIVPDDAFGDDKPLWKGTNFGDFSVGSAYEILKGTSWNLKDNKWKLGWNLQVPQRVQTFLWLVMKNALLTNEQRAGRHIAPSAFCEVCVSEIETCLHVLLDYFEAILVWQELLDDELLQTFFNLDAET